MLRLLGSFLFASLLLLLALPVHAQSPDEAERWAVIVGVSEYEHFIPLPLFPDSELYDLPYADNDAQALYQRLHPLWGQDHVKLLVNDQAAKADIEDAILSWLDPREDANDVVLFYFSGHGGQYGAHEYLSPHDALPDSYTGDIRDDELASWLDQLESRQVVTILDICNSGGFIGELAGAGRVILTASDRDEDAWAYPSLEHGVFSYYLLQGFEESAAVDANGDDIISAEELFYYARSHVIANNGRDQHPQISDGYAGELALFGLTRRGTGSISLPEQRGDSPIFYLTMAIVGVVASAATAVVWAKRRRKALPEVEDQRSD